MCCFLESDRFVISMKLYELAKITTPDVQPMTIKDDSEPKLWI